jgi:gluconokinase
LNDNGPPYILALDIGTSGIRASIYDSAANEVPELKVKAVTPFSTDGSVEPDAKILLDSVLEVLDGVAEGALNAGIRPVCVSVSCFWHSLVGIDEAARPVTPVLTWADTRAEKYVIGLRELLDENPAHNRTGCPFHSSYWPAKLLRLREEDRPAFDSARKWLSFSDLIIQRVAGVPKTGVSMASGTGLFNIRENLWDPEMLDAIGIDPLNLPEILLSDEKVVADSEHSWRWPALTSSLWLPPVGDGAANNVGAGCVGRGKAALMIGTSGAMRMILEDEVPERIPEGLFCYRLDEKRVCVGGALSDGGGMRRWMSESLGLHVTEEDIVSRLKDRGPDSHGLSFLPFVFGERSTGYHEGAKGAVIGLTRGSDAVDLTIAGMEAVAYRFSEILVRLEEVCPVVEITASGGALEGSPVWQQMIANVLGRDISVFPSGGVSRKGAAILGLESAGAAQTADFVAAPESGKVVSDPDRHAKYCEGRDRHARFYSRILA